jgi:Dockerin type I domain
MPKQYARDTTRNKIIHVPLAKCYADLEHSQISEGMMHNAAVLKIILCLAIIYVFASVADSQDSGIIDTVRIDNAVGDIAGEYSYPYSVPVFVSNDYDLNEIIIPLIIDGYSGWVRFDSISYAGSRLAGATILDNREAVLFGTDSLTVDSLVLKFALGAGVSLPAGNGKICDLWFRPNFGGLVIIDSLKESPYGRLQFVSASNETYTPAFISGLITIDCDYLIGDVRLSGAVNVQDLLGIQKGYIGCYGPDRQTPWLADINCDRRTDLRDIVDLYDYLYRYSDSSGLIGQCGTFLPGNYDDPGDPDTVWIKDDTLYVGISSVVDLGIMNDELLRGFALALEWDGSATFNFSGYAKAARLQPLPLALDDYQCQGNDGTNPDTMYIATWSDYSASIAYGTSAVATINLTPLSPGTVHFRLVSYYDDPATLTRGGESMLVTEMKAAIKPTLKGADIIVLPYKCGDANSDAKINIQDITFLISYLYKGGVPPISLQAADPDGNGLNNIQDITYLINYLYKGGPAPHCP